jgi:hypothetical protein
MSVDYTRFGRQLTLPELGAEGQARLADDRLRAHRDVADLATKLWHAAGGGDAEPALAAAAGVPAHGPEPLGVAAWCCVESARDALGAPSAGGIPPALRARLSPPR